MEADHAQHMTAHIYLALGMWEETVRANEIALQVRHKQMLAKDPKARAEKIDRLMIVVENDSAHRHHDVRRRHQAGQDQ
jgi:hypothetical protein